MPEKKFKTVLEIGGSVGSSLKNSFNVLTGNTKQLGVTIKSLKTRAKELGGELKKKKMGGPEAAIGMQALEKELARVEKRLGRVKQAGNALARIKMADFGGRIQQIGASIKRGALTITAASAAIGTAVIALTKNSANYGDEAKKASERMGMGINELIKLKHGAKLSGVEGQEFEGAVTTLFKNIEKARNGGKLRNIMDRLKLDPQKLIKMAPEERLKTFSEAFKNLKGRYAKEKGTLANVLTGNSKMANVLNLGKSGFEEAGQEAEKLNLTISTEFAKNSEIFNDNLTKIGAALKGVGNVISEHLLPHFIKLSEQFITFITGKHGDIKKWAEDFGKYLKTNVSVWIEKAKKFASEVERLGKIAWNVIKPLGGVKFVIGSLVALPFLGAAKGIAFLGFSMLGCAPAASQLLVAMGPIGWTLLGIGAAIGIVWWKWDWISKKLKEFAGPVIDNVNTAIGDLRAQLSSLIEEVRPIWEVVVPVLKSLWDGYSIYYIKALTVELKVLIKLGQIITTLFGNQLTLVVRVLNFELKILTGTLMAVKSLGSKMMGLWKGSTVPIAGARVFGGPVSSGKRYLVGERGPEIFQPRTSGQIIPNDNLRSANRTINNHITINAAPGMNERVVADLVMARLNRQQLIFAGGALYD